MSPKLVAFVCFQAFLLQGRVFAQVILPQFLSNPIVETVVPGCGCQQVPQIAPQVVSVPQMLPTTVQGSSVSNSLSNALQLLVVSNLLSTTLPSNEVVLPCAGASLLNNCYAPSVVSPVLPSCGCGFSSLNAYGGLVNVL